MNCRKGDLARIVAPAGSPNRDRIVRCVRLMAVGEELTIGDFAFLPTSHAEFWEVEGRLIAERFDGGDVEVPGGVIGDKWLRPIRPGEGDDETLTWAGRPQDQKVPA